MVSRLISVPKLDIVYRSMTVPHFECWTASAPVYPAIVLDLSQPSATLPWSYGWTSFPKYDQFWATALDQAAPHGQTEDGGRVTFLNITEVTGQRIDEWVSNDDQVLISRPCPRVSADVNAVHLTSFGASHCIFFALRLATSYSLDISVRRITAPLSIHRYQ